MQPNSQPEPSREGHSLDLTNRKDIALVNNLLTQQPRFNISPDRRQWMMNQALEALEAAKGNPELRVKILELLRKFEAMNQADEHLAIKLATDAVRPPSVIEVKYRKDGVE
jgi:hypothetical protein